MEIMLEEKKILRNSNIELLRIISMLLILGYHMITNGLVKPSYLIWETGSVFNKIVALFFFPAGRIGVMLFFMITGYFLILKDKCSPKKIVIKTLFYCFLLNIFFVFFQYFYHLYDGTFNWKNYFQKNLLIPISSGMH